MWKPIIFDVECIVCNKSLQKIGNDPKKSPRDMGKVTTINNRRLRTPNWSPEEKQCLLELINARKAVVVNKSNNGPNISEEKSQAWNEILLELRTRFGAKFSGIKKVKTQWQNMKRLARDEITQNGPTLSKLNKQTVDVCEILDMVKDGVLKMEASNFNETILSNNVEIKTERIDEDVIPGCSVTKPAGPSAMIIDAENNKENIILNRLESSASSASEQVSINESEVSEDPNQSTSFTKKNAAAMTDEIIKESNGINPFHKEMQDYFKFISAEKLMKMESIKEERQVIRAMRETAELNKIIAEQKLKHVLWVKKTEMA